MPDAIIDDNSIPRLTFNPDFPESEIRNSRTKSFEKNNDEKKIAVQQYVPYVALLLMPYRTSDVLQFNSNCGDGELQYYCCIMLTMLL